MKKTTLLVLAFATFLMIESCQQKQQAKPLHPNILWIVSEDNSPFLGCYGDTFATTPVLDSLAKSSILYENAFAAAPVCAPTRSTLITGMYANSLGTENMRSNYPIPDFIKFYPKYLKAAGYYCTNHDKKDYNTVDQPEAWDESSKQSTYRNRKPGQPFFHIINLGVTHESSVHDSIPWDQLRHDPTKVPIPAYHPRTPQMEHDWAQYYDKVEDMDTQVGQILKQLKDDGLADSTIVFYYSDHGGVLGRSKRFMYESGTHVPLIIHFPKMYQSLAPSAPGTRTDRIVSFVDFAATLLSLAGVSVPEYMQGKAFLGPEQQAPRDYAYNFRGRMDERIDLSRAVRNKEYRYIRNYMPQRIYGQYLEYLWRAPSMRSWEREYKAGHLNAIQSKFWEPKPAEELFDVKADPDNVHNLADDPAHQQILDTLRKANKDWMRRIKDAGFIPEPMKEAISKTTTIYDYVRQPDYPFDRIMETADMATMRDPKYLDEIKKRLNDENPIVRYWAVNGCIILNKQAMDAKPALAKLLDDPEISVRIAAAEALYDMHEKSSALKTLMEALKSDNKMARVQALNVLDLMGNDARPALDEVKALVKAKPQGLDYDSRAAAHLVDELGGN